MAQKAYPTILRPTQGFYDGFTSWNEPKLYYVTSTIYKLVQSCCANTNHYVNTIQINKSHGLVVVHVNLIHLHYRSKRKQLSRRFKENKTKSTAKSWPIVACRLQSACQLVQQFTGTKKVLFNIARTKVYTRSIPRSARKELSFFSRGFNRTKYDYARHGMQLLHFVLTNRANTEVLSRFIQDNICSRQRRKRHYQFLGYLKQSLRALEPYKTVQGIKIQIKGRFTHKAKSRSRCWKCQIGSVPLSQLDKKIQTTYTQTQTAYGSVGLKIWVCT